MSAPSASRVWWVLAAGAADTPGLEDMFLIEDPAAAREAMVMARLFTAAVGAEGRFDLERARALVAADPELHEARVLDQELVQDELKVAQMVDRVCARLEQFLGMTLAPRQRQQIGIAIEYGFVNLYRQATDARIFYKKQTGHSTHYRYNVFFAVQNAGTGNFVYGAPLGMDIVVSREYERVPFITLKDRVSYRVRLKSLKVAAPFAARIQAALERMVARPLAGHADGGIL